MKLPLKMVLELQRLIYFQMYGNQYFGDDLIRHLANIN